MALFGRKGGRDDKGVPATEAIAKRAPHALARLSEDFTIGALETALLKDFPAEDAEEWDRTGLLVGEPALGALETALLKDFPAEDAEEWDRTGLLVGEPALPARKMALALDPTVAGIARVCSSASPRSRPARWPWRSTRRSPPSRRRPRGARTC